MTQLRVSLFESGVIKGYGTIDVRLFFNARYVISENIVDRAYPLSIDAQWRVDE